ncbi:hypothetical protein L1987_87279 [Smallanthus sonchifolius]|nr:hypothetical protein L1987_87279 [Smallanthus sonchifolius]
MLNERSVKDLNSSQRDETVEIREVSAPSDGDQGQNSPVVYSSNSEEESVDYTPIPPARNSEFVAKERENECLLRKLEAKTKELEVAEHAKVDLETKLAGAWKVVDFERAFQEKFEVEQYRNQRMVIHFEAELHLTQGRMSQVERELQDSKTEVDQLKRILIYKRNKINMLKSCIRDSRQKNQG